MRVLARFPTHTVQLKKNGRSQSPCEVFSRKRGHVILVRHRDLWSEKKEQHRLSPHSSTSPRGVYIKRPRVCCKSSDQFRRRFRVLTNNPLQLEQSIFSQFTDHNRLAPASSSWNFPSVHHAYVHSPLQHSRHTQFLLRFGRRKQYGKRSRRR